jgi:hypothetical protein
MRAWFSTLMFMTIFKSDTNIIPQLLCTHKFTYALQLLQYITSCNRVAKLKSWC